MDRQREQQQFHEENFLGVTNSQKEIGHYYDGSLREMTMLGDVQLSLRVVSDYSLSH